MLDGDTHAAPGTRIDGTGPAGLRYAPGVAGQALDLTAASPARFPVVLRDDAFSFGSAQSFSVQVWIRTEPGVQGDRVSGARKPATLETGKVVQVPLFVETGDRIRVDTRSGDYMTRV